MRTLILSFIFVFANPILAIGADKQIPNELSEYLIKQGPILEEKLFGDFKKRLAIYYCVDENLPGGKNEGASNPANVHCEVALFNKKSNVWKFADRKLLGQGSVKSFSDNVLAVESLTYAQGDSLCCPSVRKVLNFNTLQGKLNIQENTTTQ